MSLRRKAPNLRPPTRAAIRVVLQSALTVLTRSQNRNAGYSNSRLERGSQVPARGTAEPVPHLKRCFPTVLFGLGRRVDWRSAFCFHPPALVTVCAEKSARNFHRIGMAAAVWPTIVCGSGLRRDPEYLSLAAPGCLMSESREIISAGFYRIEKKWLEW